MFAPAKWLCLRIVLRQGHSTSGLPGIIKQLQELQQWPWTTYDKDTNHPATWKTWGWVPVMHDDPCAHKRKMYGHEFC